MNKIVLLVLAGTLALLIESCSNTSNSADGSKQVKENSPNSTPAKVDPATSKATESEPVEGETSELKKSEPVQEIAGLIPATNPDIRVRTSVRGRQDPFSVVTLKPRIEIKEEEAKATDSNSKNSNSSRNNFQRANNFISTPTEEPQSIQVPFEPTLAQNVVITGLYKANGVAKLIVQAPDEPSSRYVQVGEYLSNGQILVKSIDMNHFPTPLVILEESGVEVAKAIGEKSEEVGSVSSLPTTTSGSDTWLSQALSQSN
jgi:hypothetical protein